MKSRLLKITPIRKVAGDFGNFENATDILIQKVAEEIFNSGANVDEIVKSKWVVEEEYLDENDLEDVVENYLEFDWVMPDINSLNNTTARFINNFDLILPLNHFKNRQEAIWLFQFLKATNETNKNLWINKIIDIIDNNRLGKAYTQFWKVVLWDTNSSDLPSLNYPNIGGIGPTDSESAEFMNSSWKFKSKDVLPAAIKYTIKYFAQNRSEDNPFWIEVEKSRIVQRPKIKTRLTPIFTNINLLDSLKSELEKLKRDELQKVN